MACLPPDEQGRVLSESRRRRFRRGEVLFHEGDPADCMHLLERGRVAVRIGTARGQTMTVDVLGPGEPVGELAVVAPRALRAATVMALESVETRVLSASAFAALRHEFPAVTEAVVEILARRQRAMLSRLVEACYVPVDVRVLRRLAELAALYRSANVVVVVPLTQEDLAGLAGTTRETVNRVLRRAEAAGLIGLGRGRITITDPAGLALQAE